MKVVRIVRRTYEWIIQFPFRGSAKPSVSWTSLLFLYSITIVFGSITFYAPSQLDWLLSQSIWLVSESDDASLIVVLCSKWSFGQHKRSSPPSLFNCASVCVSVCLLDDDWFTWERWKRNQSHKRLLFVGTTSSSLATTQHLRSYQQHHTTSIWWVLCNCVCVWPILCWAQKTRLTSSMCVVNHGASIARLEWKMSAPTAWAHKCTKFNCQTRVSPKSRPHNKLDTE